MTSAMISSAVTLPCSILKQFFISTQDSVRPERRAFAMQNSIFCFTVVSIRFSLNVIMGTFQLFEKHIKNHLHFYRQEMLESSPRYQIYLVKSYV